jgi:methanogenic corrinoid protein MtbC1
VTTPTDELVPIRAVSAATGLATGTLRMWERRYGRPVPVRLESGHRRYTQDHVRWLRKVAEALARGSRPGDVVPLPEGDLDALLAAHGVSEGPPSAVAEDFVRLAEALDADGMNALLQRELATHGPRAMLEATIAPALTAVGRAWADGRIEVCHEHFASEVLQDFLRGFSADPAEGATALLVVTTLPGEMHGIGARMAAAVCRLRGFEVRSLGVDTPLVDIVRAVEQTDADAVLVSISIANGGVSTDRELAELRSSLGADVRLLAGGAGARRARRGPRGVEYVQDLSELDEWLTQLAASRA